MIDVPPPAKRVSPNRVIRHCRPLQAGPTRHNPGLGMMPQIVEVQIDCGDPLPVCIGEPARRQLRLVPNAFSCDTCHAFLNVVTLRPISSLSEAAFLAVKDRARGNGSHGGGPC